MKTTRTLSLTLALVIGGTAVTFAQGMFGQQPRDSGAQMAKIFGKNISFSATVHMTTTQTGGRELPAMDMAYAVLDGKIRTEMDMTKMHGGPMRPEGIAQMKQMGMDRTVHIVLPEKKLMYMIYPGLKAYCEMSTAQKSGGTTAGKEPKIERTDLGKETLDGHPCVKSKVTVTDENGRTFVSLIWQATDLNNLPVQTQMQPDDKTTVTMQFKDINASKPAAALFEPPADYKRYGSMQEMMMNSMAPMMPRRGPPAVGGDPDN